MKKKLTPLILFIFLLILDQGSKFYIIKNIKIGEKIQFLKVFTLTHFISYKNLTGEVKLIVLIIVPLITLLILLISLLVNFKYSLLQRWTLWALLAGLTGNIIDRVFRGLGVIDIISINILPQIPVFNIATFTVAISSTIMILSLIIKDRRLK